jgi:hypothetical protein
MDGPPGLEAQSHEFKPNSTIQNKAKLKYVLNFVPFSDWRVLLLAKETGLTQAVSTISSVQNLLRKRVCAWKKHASVDIH